VLRPRWQADGLRKVALRVPAAPAQRARVLGHGAAAVPELMRVLGEMGVLPSRSASPGAAS
jgi:hypothetical protein